MQDEHALEAPARREKMLSALKDGAGGGELTLKDS